MIQIIKDSPAVAELVGKLVNDECFSTPLYDLAKAKQVMERENCVVLGAYQDGTLIGVFSFLVLPDEKYLESMFLYSQQSKAYQELMAYLKDNYPSFEVWFVLNPNNHILRGLLEQKNAFFYTEQRYMEFTGELPNIPDSVVPYSESYRDAYIALHSCAGYWTGEKMLKALDRFAVFLSVIDNKVVGYVDISTGDGTNEIFDILVDPQYRNQGIGKQLMKTAIRSNGENRLVLTVDVDNLPAIHMYEALGFVEIPANNVLTAKY